MFILHFSKPLNRGNGNVDSFVGTFESPDAAQAWYSRHAERLTELNGSTWTATVEWLGEP